MAEEQVERQHVHVRPESFQQPSISQPSKTWTPKFIGLIIVLVVIGAGMYGVLFYWQTKTANIAVPSFTPRPSRTPDLSAFWQTYKNNQYGFSFMYPGDWTIELDPDGVGFKKNGVNYQLEDESPLVINWDSTIFNNVQAWFADQFKDIKVNKPTTAHVLIGGVDALRIDDPVYMGSSKFEYVFIKNSMFFRLQFSGDQKETNQILSTFKFGGEADNPGAVCIQDAFQCPDGSYVGRIGHDCAFAPCP